MFAYPVSREMICISRCWYEVSAVWCASVFAVVVKVFFQVLGGVWVGSSCATLLSWHARLPVIFGASVTGSCLPSILSRVVVRDMTRQT